MPAWCKLTKTLTIHKKNKVKIKLTLNIKYIKKMLPLIKKMQRVLPLILSVFVF